VYSLLDRVAVMPGAMSEDQIHREIANQMSEKTQQVLALHSLAPSGGVSTSAPVLRFHLLQRSKSASECLAGNRTSRGKRMLLGHLG
jgi:hypothetical protein